VSFVIVLSEDRTKKAVRMARRPA